MTKKNYIGSTIKFIYKNEEFIIDLGNADFKYQSIDKVMQEIEIQNNKIIKIWSMELIFSSKAWICVNRIILDILNNEKNKLTNDSQFRHYRDAYILWKKQILNIELFSQFINRDNRYKKEILNSKTKINSNF